MVSQVFDQNTFKILTLFSLSPGSRFKRNDIKENVKLNNVPLDKALSRLLSSGVIKKERTYYSVNFENEYAKKLLEICSKQYKQLKELPLDVYFLLTDFVFKTGEQKYLQIYLFGSYSKLVYSEKSDVDIALLKTKKFDEAKVKKLVKKLGKVYGKRIQLHIFDKKKFMKNKKDPLVREILKDGVPFL